MSRGLYPFVFGFIILESFSKTFYGQPIQANVISQYSILYHNDSFYIFGGEIAHSKSLTTTDIVARLDSHGVWTKAGNLKTQREGHSVVFDGRYFMVVGGHKTGELSGQTLATEKCSLQSSAVSCESQLPNLTDYVYTPELILVEEDYGKTCF